MLINRQDTKDLLEDILAGCKERPSVSTLARISGVNEHSLWHYMKGGVRWPADAYFSVMYAACQLAQRDYTINIPCNVPHETKD